MYAKQLDQQEGKYVAQFRQHPVVAGLRQMKNSALEELLLQKSALALEYFEPFYNTAIRGLTREDCRQIARSIVVEEYCGAKRPNHREDAVTDLMSIGIPEETILATEMTPGTTESMRLLRELVQFRPGENRTLYDVRALTALRFGGEVLAGEEFALLCPELERRYGLTQEKSVFYWPHAGHDQKKKKFGKKGNSHADRFGKVLVEIIDSPEAFDVAMKTIEDSFVARARFYDQFQKEHTI